MHRGETVEQVIQAYDLRTDAQRAAVHRAYRTLRAHHAGFVVAVTAAMLDDLRDDARQRPGRSVLFLGRDGHSFAAATRGLDPAFAARHCAEAVLSRAVVDAAVQDLERHTPRRFDHLETFRSGRARVDASDVDGAHRMLTRYLRGIGIPVGEPGSAVTVVDSSFKGTAQELLAAVYPQTRFTGRYAFHATSPDDPHPWTKHGYVFHQLAGPRWRGLPEADLPAEAELTFGCSDAIAAIEDTLNGPSSSPRALTREGPTQAPLRQVPQPLRGLNPVLVHPDLHEPVVREAVKAVALQAVYDEARAAAASGAYHRPADRARRIGAFTEQIRAWIRRDAAADPQLVELLDGFVLRGDWALMVDVHEALRQAGAGEQIARTVWQRLAAVDELRAKHALAVELIDALPSASAHPARVAMAALTPPAGASRGAGEGPSRRAAPPPGRRREHDVSRGPSRHQ